MDNGVEQLGLFDVIRDPGSGIRVVVYRRQALGEELDFCIGFRVGEVGFNELELIVVEVRLDVGVLKRAAIE